MLATMAIGNIYLIAAISVVGGGLFGFDISSMSAILGTWQYKCYFNQGDGPILTHKDCKGPRSDVQGGITASMAGGSWLAALISGFISDVLGRKKAIMIGSVLWCAHTRFSREPWNPLLILVQGHWLHHRQRLAEHWHVDRWSLDQWSLRRHLLRPGPSLHIRISSTQQTWPACRRTAMGNYLGDLDHVLVSVESCTAVSSLSSLNSFSISYGCSFINGTAAFRVPWALQMIPAICLFFGMMFLPESPRWLARQGRWEEAHAVLTLVHGHGDPDSPFVVREYQEIKAMVEFEKENADVSYLELFKPNMINRTHIGVFTQIWSQLTGMNVMSKSISCLPRTPNKMFSTFILLFVLPKDT